MTKHEGSSNDRDSDFVIPSSFLKRLTIRLVNVFAPNNEDYVLGIIAHREKFARRFDGNLRCFLNRKTVRAATDRRKRHFFDFIFHRKLQ